MALAFDDTELAPVELPKGVTGFGSAEMAYLAARHDTPVMARTRQLLLPKVEVPSDAESPAFALVQAGASSLAARGLVKQVEGDDPLASKAEAAMLEYAMSQAESWTRVVASDERWVDIAFFLAAPPIAAMAQPRALDMWFTGFNEGEPSAGQMAMTYIDAMQTQHPGASYQVKGWTLHEGPEAIYAAWHTEAERWVVLDRPPEADKGNPEYLDEQGLLGRILALTPRE